MRVPLAEIRFCMTTTIKMPLRKVTQHVLRDLQQKYPDAEMQLALGGHKADRDGLLTYGQFWELIHLLDWNKTGDDDAVVEPLVAALTAGQFAKFLISRIFFPKNCMPSTV